MADDPHCHVWREIAGGKWIALAGHKNAVVRVKPSPNGKYLFQYRTVASYADTIERAKEYVEAAAESGSARCLKN